MTNCIRVGGYLADGTPVWEKAPGGSVPAAPAVPTPPKPCSVCNARGEVPRGYYDTKVGSREAWDMVPCRKCDGKGVEV